MGVMREKNANIAEVQKKTYALTYLAIMDYEQLGVMCRMLISVMKKSSQWKICMINEC